MGVIPVSRSRACKGPRFVRRVERHRGRVSADQTVRVPSATIAVVPPSYTLWLAVIPVTVSGAGVMFAVVVGCSSR